jgi:hypothetical protein
LRRPGRCQQRPSRIWQRAGFSSGITMWQSTPIARSRIRGGGSRIASHFITTIPSPIPLRVLCASVVNPLRGLGFGVRNTIVLVLVLVLVLVRRSPFEWKTGSHNVRPVPYRAALKAQAIPRYQPSIPSPSVTSSILSILPFFYPSTLPLTASSSSVHVGMFLLSAQDT